jgi:feruloyl esterase
MLTGCVALAANASFQRPSAGTACDALTALTMPDVTITSAANVPEGQLTLGRPLAVPAFCRVMAVATPTPDSHINVEVWMPPAALWNGKFLGTDNGGFSGAIGYAAMASAVRRGYATAGTDTGHTGDQMAFGVGHPEKIIDWSYRAVHVMTELARVIIRSHEGRFPSRTYFSGCSTGGQQALSEAQRYPADYDGIVAGDPGNNRLHLIYGFLWSWMATHDPDGVAILPTAKLPAIAAAAMAACDATDGLQDGIIGEPRACRFDPAALACAGAETDSCLTPPQVEAVRKVYGGARNPRTGAQIYPGWAPGSEAGWRTYITGAREPVRVDLFKGWAFHDPNWDMRTFDWDRDVAYIDGHLPMLNAMATDLGAFKRLGGKLLMYTGLADPVVPPGDTIAYYEAVVQAMGGAGPTSEFFRFFAAPGMAHCGGGVGPNTFDTLGAIEAWVERGVAPEVLVASHSAADRVDRTRPLCAYPRKARYKGTGSIDEAANFACVR